jgi:hypothetical protein
MKKGIAVAVAMLMMLSTITVLSGVSVAVDDTDAPTIFDVKPVVGTFVSPLMSGGGVNVSAQYSDAGSGINVATVALFIDGELMESVANDTAVYCATYLDDGIHQGVIFVSDNAGNEADTETIFIVDSKNPKVKMVSPTFSLFKKVSATPLIKATLTDNYDVAGFQVLIDAKAVSGVAWVQTGTGAYSISYQVPPGALRPGYHSIVVIATDLAGNMGYGISMFGV